ncbi:hypothetical protein EJ04DRAFT_231198 [Polyplosphaeria fusca]|uniref:Uncharacterized protein n=1 Tax=Polyplosphaeria fusca TaxID=682080 RepID=A0A9P4R064_9PLEO|nr:hypothetical protein EJ04DRAFT_231198 [Polyplosphaeria fusca]
MPSNSNQPPWPTTTTTSPPGTTSSSASQQTYLSPTPLHPAYPQAFQPRPQQQQTAFHHYQPPQQQNTTTTQHQITAPFQIPRMPHPWPVPGQQAQGGSVPIDPALLAGGGRGGGGDGKGNGNGTWPSSSGR